MWTYNYSQYYTINPQNGIIASKPDTLTHHGVLGMKWGVRRTPEQLGHNKKSKRLDYKSRIKNKYLEKGYSENDAEALALRRKKIRTAALITGGVTIAVGAAFVARYYHIENNDVLLKTGSKVFHIARKDAGDLESGRHLYTTIDQFDRKAYQWRLNNPEKVQKVERVFELMKDIKVPSPKKGEKLYNEFMKDSKNKEKIKKAFEPLIKLGLKNLDIDYKDFIAYSPYFSEGESFGAIGKITSNNKTGADLWKDYQNFIVNKGFQGLLDENDRNPDHGFNVERPAILFDAASKLKETSRLNLKENSLTSLIPTLREVGSVKTAGTAVSVGGIVSLNNAANTRMIENYRLKHPNSKLTDKEIIKTYNKKAKR